MALRMLLCILSGCTRSEHWRLQGYGCAGKGSGFEGFFFENNSTWDVFCFFLWYAVAQTDKPIIKKPIIGSRHAAWVATLAVSLSLPNSYEGFIGAVSPSLCCRARLLSRQTTRRKGSIVGSHLKPDSTLSFLKQWSIGAQPRAVQDTWARALMVRFYSFIAQASWIYHCDEQATRSWHPTPTNFTSPKSEWSYTPVGRSPAKPWRR